MGSPTYFSSLYLAFCWGGVSFQLQKFSQNYLLCPPPSSVSPRDPPSSSPDAVTWTPDLRAQESPSDHPNLTELVPHCLLST